MDIKDIVTRINAVDVGLAEAKKDLLDYMKNNRLLASATATVESKYEFDSNQMLAHARQASGGARVDPIVGADCPYTVVCGQTGHVLSVARPDLGEMFLGYCMRVADQATDGKGDEYSGSIGSLFLGTEHLFREFGGYNPNGANWPSAADKFYNLRAYMSVAERAKDDSAQQQWEAWDKVVKDRIEREKNPQQPDGTQVALPEGETPL